MGKPCTEHHLCIGACFFDGNSIVSQVPHDLELVQRGEMGDIRYSPINKLFLEQLDIAAGFYRWLYAGQPGADCTDPGRAKYVILILSDNRRASIKRALNQRIKTGAKAHSPLK